MEPSLLQRTKASICTSFSWAHVSYILQFSVPPYQECSRQCCPRKVHPPTQHSAQRPPGQHTYLQGSGAYNCNCPSVIPSHQPHQPHQPLWGNVNVEGMEFKWLLICSCPWRREDTAGQAHHAMLIVTPKETEALGHFHGAEKIVQFYPYLNKFRSDSWTMGSVPQSPPLRAEIKGIWEAGQTSYHKAPTAYCPSLLSLATISPFRITSCIVSQNLTTRSPGPGSPQYFQIKPKTKVKEWRIRTGFCTCYLRILMPCMKRTPFRTWWSKPRHTSLHRPPCACAASNIHVDEDNDACMGHGSDEEHSTHYPARFALYTLGIQ